eukprot:TRINITY_DN121487_c0_g1_i1.p1 TRINITY_DN121487_c0_g1~~TRINITY_DN121487_c0_g1_i1.p1  ORF type:complete len:374 (+),score=82.25 TRINITY_DN121487_c0_g1_i1:72-1124(+)
MELLHSRELDSSDMGSLGRDAPVSYQTHYTSLATLAGSSSWTMMHHILEPVHHDEYHSVNHHELRNAAQDIVARHGGPTIHLEDDPLHPQTHMRTDGHARIQDACAGVVANLPKFERDVEPEDGRTVEPESLAGLREVAQQITKGMPNTMDVMLDRLAGSTSSAGSPVQPKGYPSSKDVDPKEEQDLSGDDEERLLLAAPRHNEERAAAISSAAEALMQLDVMLAHHHGPLGQESRRQLVRDGIIPSMQIGRSLKSKEEEERMAKRSQNADLFRRWDGRGTRKIDKKDLQHLKNIAEETGDKELFSMVSQKLKDKAAVEKKEKMEKKEKTTVSRALGLVRAARSPSDKFK